MAALCVSDFVAHAFWGSASPTPGRRKPQWPYAPSPPSRLAELNGVAPDGALTEKSWFQSLNLTSRLSARLLTPLAWVWSDGGTSIAKSIFSSVGRWLELSNDSDPCAVLIARSTRASCSLSFGVIPLWLIFEMSATSLAKSRSAEIVSWPSAFDRLRFLSHMLGS